MLWYEEHAALQRSRSVELQRALIDSLLAEILTVCVCAKFLRNLLRVKCASEEDSDYSVGHV